MSNTSIIALYVYSPTTIQTDRVVDSMAGTHLSAGEVKLQPGIYRILAEANVAVTSGTPGSDYDKVALSGTKGGWPDPPLQAIEQNHTTKADVVAFLGGEGDENDLT